MLKKLLFILFFLASLTFLSPVYAATNPNAPTPATVMSGNIIKEKQDAIKLGNNQEAWLDEALGSNIISGIRVLGGNIPDYVFKGQTAPNGTVYIPDGAIGGTSKIITALYNPPISGIQYLAQIKDNFLGKPAYAQGVGFIGFKPLLPIWQIFRNFIYLASSFILIIISLMIIFRVKINPQTVITLQNAIPQLIGALILVTFSYAIAGLLVDLIYFIQAFIISLLFTAQGKSLTTNLFQPGILETFIQFVQNNFGFILNYNHVYDFQNLSNPTLTQYFSLLQAALPFAALFALGGIIGSLVGTIVGVISLNPVFVVVGGVGGIAVGGALIILIFQVVILISLIKFFFGLIKAYLTVLLKVILAPLEIGAGAFPNSKFNFSTWLRDIVANLAVFPISVIFIVLVNLIIRNVGYAIDIIWVPSLLEIAPKEVSQFIPYRLNIIPAVIGIGAILMLAKLPDLIIQTIFQIKPSPYGAAIGEGLKPITSTTQFAGQTALQTGANEAYRSYATASAPGGSGPSWSQKLGKGVVDAASFLKIIKEPRP